MPFAVKTFGRAIVRVEEIDTKKMPSLVKGGKDGKIKERVGIVSDKEIDNNKVSTAAENSDIDENSENLIDNKMNKDTGKLSSSLQTENNDVVKVTAKPFENIDVVKDTTPPFEERVLQENVLPQPIKETLLQLGQDAGSDVVPNNLQQPSSASLATSIVHTDIEAPVTCQRVQVAGQAPNYEGFYHRLRSIAANDEDGAVDAADISLKSMCDHVGGSYNRINVIANRQMQVAGTREHRFRVWIVKGYKQFNRKLAEDPTYSFGPTDDFGTVLIDNFYLTSFPSETKDLAKLRIDNDMWHIVIIGHRNTEAIDDPTKPMTQKKGNLDQEKKVESPWEVIGALSFYPQSSEVEMIYLSWLAVAAKPASLSYWIPSLNLKKNQKTRKLYSSFFDDKPFKNGKGLGSQLMVFMQFVCAVIAEDVEGKKLSDMKSRSIICQSAIMALPFYKTALGFVEVDHSKVPPVLISKFLDTPFLVTVMSHDFIKVVRPHDMRTERSTVADLFKQAIYTQFIHNKDKYKTVQSARYYLLPELKASSLSTYFSCSGDRRSLSLTKQLKDEQVTTMLPEDHGYLHTRKRVNTPDSEKLILEALNLTTSVACLVVVPTAILPNAIVRMLMVTYFLGVDQVDVFFANKSKVENADLVRFLSNSENVTFDRERQFLIHFTWLLSKYDCGVPKPQYDNKDLYEREEYKIKTGEDDNGDDLFQTKHRYINTKAQQKRGMTYTDFESTVMTCDDFIKLLAASSNLKALETRKGLTPKAVQTAFRDIAMKLGRDLCWVTNDAGKESYSCPIETVLWVVSFAFKVRIIVVRYSKAKGKNTFACKQEVICARSDGEVVDEILLNETCLPDMPNKEWSVLVRQQPDHIDALQKCFEKYLTFTDDSRTRQAKELKERGKAALRKVSPDENVINDEAESLSNKTIDQDSVHASQESAVIPVTDQRHAALPVIPPNNSAASLPVNPKSNIEMFLNDYDTENEDDLESEKKMKKKKNFLLARKLFPELVTVDQVKTFVEGTMRQDLIQCGKVVVSERIRTDQKKDSDQEPQNQEKRKAKPRLKIQKTKVSKSTRKKVKPVAQESTKANKQVVKKKGLKKTPRASGTNTEAAEPISKKRKDHGEAIETSGKVGKFPRVEELSPESGEQPVNINPPVDQLQPPIDEHQVDQEEFVIDNTLTAVTTTTDQVAPPPIFRKQPRSHLLVDNDDATQDPDEEREHFSDADEAEEQDLGGEEHLSDDAGAEESESEGEPAQDGPLGNKIFLVRKTGRRRAGEQPGIDESNDIMQPITYTFSSRNDSKLRTVLQNASEAKEICNEESVVDTTKLINEARTITINTVPDELRTNLESRKIPFDQSNLNYGSISRDVHNRFKSLVEESKTAITKVEKLIKKAKEPQQKRVHQQRLAYLQNYDRTLKESLQNEVYLEHPDNIVAIRRLPVPIDRIYTYEAITAANIERNMRTTIYLTTWWVRCHFQEEFLNVVKEMKLSSGYIEVRKKSANITKEDQQFAEELDKMLFESDDNGGLDGARKRILPKRQTVMVIVMLKYVAQYVGKASTEPVKEQFYIKSTPITTYKARKRDDYGDWVFIDDSLVMNKRCVGGDIAHALINDVETKRLAQIEELKRSKSLTDAIGKFDIESSVHSFHGPVKDMPCYVLGEKQIAGIKWDSERGHYYGKVLESVSRDGRVRHTHELLSNEWIEENITASFANILKQKQNTFLWVPVGDARPNSYPYEYDRSLPSICFKQETRPTCVTSSFASFFAYYLNTADVKILMSKLTVEELKVLFDFPSEIESFGRAYVANVDLDQTKVLAKLCHWLDNSPVFKKFFMTRRIDIHSFDIWSNDTKNIPKLLQLKGGDGGVAHAITIHNEMIFDSNLDFAVELSLRNIEYCVDAAYDGIFAGYEILQKKKRKHSVKKKRRQKRKAHVDSIL